MINRRKKMKVVTSLLVMFATIAIFGQSGQDQQDKQWRQEMTNRNGFPATTQFPTSPWVVSGTSAAEEVMKSFPIIIPPRNAPELTKEEIEELKREEKRVNALRAPHQEDVDKYSNLLNQKNTGIFRLFPDLGCGGQLLVNANDDCANAVSLSWSYSFIYKYHGNSDFYDIRLKDQSLIADGFLSQSIVTKLGDVDLETANLKTKGIKFLDDFNPERKSIKAKAQFAQIAKTVNSDGFVYGKMANLDENVTFGMRIIAYKLSDANRENHLQRNKINTEEEQKFLALAYTKRKDKIIVFRIIRKDLDGSVTILWKELSDKKAPVLVFGKNEKLTDLKTQK